MNVNMRIPFFKISYHRNNNYIFIFVIVVAITSIVGYIMNFQNIFQYFPDMNNISTISDFVENCSIKFAISCIGVFVTPIGVICGYIF